MNECYKDEKANNARCSGDKKNKKSYQKPQLKKYKGIKKIIASTPPVGIVEI